jgi:hypothetical protein
MGNENVRQFKEQNTEIILSDDESISNWKELYNILVSDREQLADFINKYGTYDNLKSLIIDIEKYGNNDKNFTFNEILLGYRGYEYNKQKAIYELPTLELIKFIDNLCQLLNINKVEELIAGQGLLSKLLSVNTNLIVNATDGYKCIQTSNTNKYYNVNKKLIIEYTLEDNTYDDTLLIMAFPSKYCIKDMEKLFDKNKPKQLLLIRYHHMYYLLMYIQ